MQSYVNTDVEVSLRCSNCSASRAQISYARELLLTDERTPLIEQILHLADQGLILSTITCTRCAQPTCIEAQRIVTFGDVLIFRPPPTLCARQTLPPLEVVLPPGARRSRGGAPSRLVLRAILFTCTLSTEEHHVVADVDHSSDAVRFANHYDPLLGQVEGPPPDKYTPTHAIYTPIVGKTEATLTKFPTIAALNARSLARLAKATISRKPKVHILKDPRDHLNKKRGNNPSSSLSFEPIQNSQKKENLVSPKKLSSRQTLASFVLPAGTTRQRRATPASSTPFEVDDACPEPPAPTSSNSRGELSGRSTRQAPLPRDFGMISLFDGVSTPARTLIDRHQLLPKPFCLQKIRKQFAPLFVNNTIYPTTPRPMCLPNMAFR